MPEIDVTIFSDVNLSDTQQTQIQELKHNIETLKTENAALEQLQAAHEELIEVCFDYRQYEIASDSLDFIRNEETIELNDIETATLARRFGVLAFSRDDIETAKTEFTNAFTLIEEHVEETTVVLKAKLLSNLGNVATMEEDFGAAIEYYETAIELNEENEVDDAIPFHNLGLVYLKNQNLDDAADCFEAALEIFQEEENTTQQEEIHLQLGAIYFAQDNMTDALRNYHYATELQEENSERLGKTYVSMVSILLKMGENEKAIEFYEKALPILAQNEDIEIKSEHYFQIGNLYSRYLENYDNAIKYYQKSLTVAQSDTENEEWRDLMVAKLEDSINENQAKLSKKQKKKSGLFSRLFGK